MSATSWKRPTIRISHVYFVESGLVSVVGAAARRDHRIEIGMVGFTEGMTGLSVVLGGDRSTNETLVQSAGSALRISTGRSLREMLDTSREPHRQPAALRQRVHGAGQPDGPLRG